MPDFLTEATTRVIANIGQIDPASRKALEQAAKRGDIAKWRGHWYPIAGAPGGLGALKTCYGPAALRDRLLAWSAGR